MGPNNSQALAHFAAGAKMMHIRHTPQTFANGCGERSATLLATVRARHIVLLRWHLAISFYVVPLRPYYYSNVDLRSCLSLHSTSTMWLLRSATILKFSVFAGLQLNLLIVAKAQATLNYLISQAQVSCHQPLLYSQPHKQENSQATCNTCSGNVKRGAPWRSPLHPAVTCLKTCP